MDLSLTLCLSFTFYPPLLFSLFSVILGLLYTFFFYFLLLMFALCQCANMPFVIHLLPYVLLSSLFAVFSFIFISLTIFLLPSFSIILYSTIPLIYLSLSHSSIAAWHLSSSLCHSLNMDLKHSSIISFSTLACFSLFSLAHTFSFSISHISASFSSRPMYLSNTPHFLWLPSFHFRISPPVRASISPEHTLPLPARHPPVSSIFHPSHSVKSKFIHLQTFFPLFY